MITQQQIQKKPTNPTQIEIMAIGVAKSELPEPDENASLAPASADGAL